MRLSDSHNKSETNNPPKISQILKNCNKLIAKNIASRPEVESGSLPCECPNSLDYKGIVSVKA